MKLEKMEFGGIKGRSLSEMVVQIFSDFQEQVAKFSNSTYNPLDLTDKVLERHIGQTMQSASTSHSLYTCMWHLLELNIILIVRLCISGLQSANVIW